MRGAILLACFLFGLDRFGNAAADELLHHAGQQIRVRIAWLATAPAAKESDLIGLLAEHGSVVGVQWSVIKAAKP